MGITESRSPITRRSGGFGTANRPVGSSPLGQRADGQHIAPHVGKNALRHAPRTDVQPLEPTLPSKPVQGGPVQPVSPTRR
jgi:hypothetical protein